MPTIRITEDTLKELERIANEYKKLKRTGFESPFKITPDIVIKQLVQEHWNKAPIKNQILEMRNKGMTVMAIKEKLGIGNHQYYEAIK